MPLRTEHLRGLLRLVRDGVVHGATAVETIEKGYAARTYSVLRAIPLVAGPASVVELVHSAVRAGTYGSIRGVTEVVAGALEMTLDALDVAAPSKAAEPADSPKAAESREAPETPETPENPDTPEDR